MSLGVAPGQTVTTVPALVYAAAPSLFGETTALVDVMPSTPLANFAAVGDAQMVRLGDDGYRIPGPAVDPDLANSGVDKADDRD